jgi:hypothetical protein
MLATITAIATAKLFYQNLSVGSNYTEFPSHAVSAFGNERWKGRSFGKLDVLLHKFFILFFFLEATIIKYGISHP